MKDRLGRGLSLSRGRHPVLGSFTASNDASAVGSSETKRA